MMTQWLKGDKKELSVDLVFKAAREGDPLANQILEGTGKYLGIATANMINILKPSKIILEGRIFEGDDFVLTPLKQMVNQYSLRSSQEGIEIVCSKLGKKGMVLGAVTLVLNKLFMPGGL
jgi:predicted NBD/HSP70 family sugar kinase